MNGSVFTMYLLNFIFIGLLPIFFFRRHGRLNIMWWVTAAPFFVCPLLLAMGFAGYIEPLGPEGWRTPLETISVVPSMASIALIFFTLGTHRTRLALWHQNDDAPRSIVTHGAYSRIRHPFYVSFIFAFAGAFVFFSHWGTFLILVYASVLLNFTAAKEEKRLGASEFGTDYQKYMNRTGRFWPQLSVR